MRCFQPQLVQKLLYSTPKSMSISNSNTNSIDTGLAGGSESFNWAEGEA